MSVRNTTFSLSAIAVGACRRSAAWSNLRLRDDSQSIPGLGVQFRRLGVTLVCSSAMVLASSAVVFIALPSALHAQSSSGSIIGSVVDVTGAGVPGATVRVTNLATNETKTVQTNGTGDYRFLDIAPASYKVEVEAKGFKQFVVETAAVQVNSSVRVDAAMQVGAATETVVVTTQPPLLQTDSGTVGYEVEGKQVQEMPLNGRNVMNLIALVPGVVPQGASQGSAGENQQSHTSNVGWGNYQIGGGIAGQSAEYLDGAPLNVLGANTVGLVPTQDYIQEFRVETNAVSPEFGRFAGGVVELATKSGGNAFHGTVYEYFRNAVLNGNNFFAKQAGTKRSPWNQNQYGADLGGPLKKDKAFFFFSWEGFNSLLGVSNPTNVPTAAMQAGVFSKKIVDPTGKCAIVQNVAAGTWTVPQTCWDPTAAILKTVFPLPITPGASSNYYVAPITGTNSDQYSGRVDDNITAKQKLFARYTFWKLQDLSPDEFKSAGGFKSGNSFSKAATHQAVLGDTYSVKPNLIADFRASYLRSFYNQVPPSLGTDQGQYGAAFGAIQSRETYKTFPIPVISGTNGLWAFGPVGQISQDRWNTYGLSGSLISVFGHHTIKVGGAGRLAQRSGFGGLSSVSGRFTFTNAYTGDEFASFLLGQFTSDTLTTTQTTDTYNYSQGYYGTDTWQLKHGLALNLGLRWELPGGMQENHDRATVLLPNTVDPYTGVRGTLALVNSSLYAPRTLEQIHHRLFSPRIGVAQRLGAKSVVRGGYGLVYLSPDLPTGTLAFNSTVNQAVTTVVNPGAAPTTFLNNPFPSGILLPVGRSNPAFMMSRLGQVVVGPIPNQPYPYVQQWNVVVDQQFSDNISLQIGYVGSKGTHLPSLAAVGINELGRQYYGMGTNLLAAATTPGQTVGQSLRPYPAYQNLSNNEAYIGSSTYHSLQTQGQVRLHSGGVLTGNYTWAKMLTDTDTLNGGVEQSTTSGAEGVYQDYNNLKGERSISSYDVKNRGVINYVLDLPFGKGHRLGANVRGVADKFVSGWTVNGITSFQSGFPLPFTYSGGNILTKNFGAATLRPNIVSGCQRTVSGSNTQRALGGWFNTACYAYPGDYAFGNAPRSDATIRSQGVANYDFSLLKATAIRDNLTTQFRMEFFNIFNHTQFSAPGASLNGANFGKVITQLNQPRQIQASLRFNF